MPIYVQTHERSDALRLWTIEDESAIRVGANRASPGARYLARPGEDIWNFFDANKALFPGGRDAFHLVKLQPGQFYPRIARPHADSFSGRNFRSPSTRTLTNELTIAESQLLVLCRELQVICQTIHPVADNLRAYGHAIRNLLILACTEVESHWRAVLHANNYFSGSATNRFNTNDYVKLATAMKLREYGVTFPKYPWLSQFKPFAAWSTSEPTTSMPWYDSYNAVKHDRESSFARGWLQHVFEAVAANVIMMATQFGLYECFRQNAFADEFVLTEFAVWSPGDVYLSPMHGEIESPTKYPF